MEVIKIKLTLIKPYWRNPRENRETINMIKDSIGRYGFTNPILLDKKNTIIAGHARYKALLELGYDEADCIISDMDEELAKEYRIVDNKIHEATGWNLPELKLELKELDLNVMQKFFDIDLKNELEKDLNFKLGFDIDKGDIEKAGTILKNENKITEQNDQDRKVDVVCPYCYEKFFLNKDEI